MPRKQDEPGERMSVGDALRCVISGVAIGAFSFRPMCEVDAAALGVLAVALMCTPRRGRAIGYPSLLLSAWAATVAAALFGVSDGWQIDITWLGFARRAVLPLGIVVWLGWTCTASTECFFTRGGVLAKGALLLLFTGVTVQISALGRLASRLGLGSYEDDRVFLAVFSGLVALGGVAFGRLFRRTSPSHVAGALGVTSVASFAALPIVAAITTPRGFRALCGRFGADASLAGTPLVDALVAAAAFALPALALGCALHLARDWSPVAIAVAGAALGRALVDSLLPKTFTSIAEASAALGSAGLIPAGALIAAGGALLMTMAHRRTRGMRAFLPLTAGLVTLGFSVPVSPVRVVPPWQRFPRTPTAMFETAAGQFTVLPLPGGSRQVLLNQQPLSPDEDGMILDRACLSDALQRKAVPPSCTVVGLLTPDRARVLAAAGFTHIDRSARWGAATPLLERLLFADEGAVPPPGDHLTQRDSLFSDEPYGRPGIRLQWHESSRAAPRVGPMIADGLRGFAMERASDASVAEVSPHAPTVLEWMSVRPDNRPRAAFALQAKILEEMDPSPFHRGLRLHADAQVMSSPFEDADEAVELSFEVLDVWREWASTTDEFTPFERSCIEGAALVLQAQREVPATYAFVGPIAAAHAPWPVLERILAWADIEELRVDDARARLDALHRSDPTNVTSARALAAVLLDLERGAEAAEVLRPLSDADPGDRALRTDFAEALVVAGDPEGRRIAASLLRDDLENPRLFALTRGLRSLEPNDE